MAKEAAEQATTPTKVTNIDIVDAVGTLTFAKAVQNFGKEKALFAMKEVARIGGHGLFDDNELMHPLFGGLAMPHPDSVIKPEKADFAGKPEADFYYSAAVEEYEKLRVITAENRKAIGQLFEDLKK